jgi:hypothetical protein
MMPRFTHFNIWDNDLKDFMNEIESNEALSFLSEEIREWFYWDGCCIYIESELNTLHMEALACVKQFGRFTDMSGPTMEGHVFEALDAVATAFNEYFKDNDDEATNKFLKDAFDKFIVSAIRKHKAFYKGRATIMDKLEPRKLQSPRTKPNGSIELNSITDYLLTGLEGIRDSIVKSQEYKNFDAEDLLSDINCFVIYRKEYERFAFDMKSTPRVTRSPILSSKLFSSLQLVSSSSDSSSQQLGIQPSNVTERLMKRLSAFRFFEKKPEVQPDSTTKPNDKPTKLDYVPMLLTPTHAG